MKSAPEWFLSTLITTEKRETSSKLCFPSFLWDFYALTSLSQNKKNSVLIKNHSYLGVLYSYDDILIDGICVIKNNKN